jgi:xylitol oxidase
MAPQLTNWAGNVVFAAASTSRPRSLDELREVVARADRVRALGSGHSFSDIADTPGVLVSLDDLPPVFEVAPDRGSVRVSAPTRLADLAAALHREGLALPTMPSLPHISIAGACLTATHGSGDRTGSLASAVRAVEVVRADGALEVVSAPDQLAGQVVSLGALGVVTALELAVVPAFDVEQVVHESLPWPAFGDHLDEVFGSAFSVCGFTDWRDRVDLWVKRRVDGPAVDLARFGAVPADGPRHPIVGQPPENCTAQLGAVGPWHERLPHFRAGFVPSVGAELQSEYFVAREHAREALLRLRKLADVLAPVLQVSEIRTVAADEWWLSPFHQRDSIGFHFTWVLDPDGVRAVVQRIEQELAPFDARPHWGKVFLASPEHLYPKWQDFRALVAAVDPTGKFRNPWLDRLFG